MSTLNQAQRVLLETYANGEFSHVTSIDEARDVGDTLFTFLFIELSVQEDCVNLNQAHSRVENAIRELRQVSSAIFAAGLTPDEKAQKALDVYSLPEGVTIEQMSGWERVNQSLELTRILYLKYDDDAPDADSHKATYHVKFSADGEVVEDYILGVEHGNDIGESGLSSSGEPSLDRRFYKAKAALSKYSFGDGTRLVDCDAWETGVPSELRCLVHLQFSGDAESDTPYVGIYVVKFDESNNIISDEAVELETGISFGKSGLVASPPKAGGRKHGM